VSFEEKFTGRPGPKYLLLKKMLKMNKKQMMMMSNLRYPPPGTAENQRLALLPKRNRVPLN
jgi:hypothetical protein